MAGRARRARSQSLRCDYRQPERQDDGSRRSARLRRGEENQWTQAPRLGRCGRTRARPRTASGEHSGSRRRRPTAMRLPRLVSLYRSRLRRQRIPRPRTLLRVDQSKPKAGEGFRCHNRLGHGIPLCRLHHALRSTSRKAAALGEADRLKISPLFHRWRSGELSHG